MGNYYHTLLVSYISALLLVGVLPTVNCVNVGGGGSKGVSIGGVGTRNCPPLPPHEPKDINDLRPNNIKVVMALGDSITAAFGIMGNDGELNEFRGQSWSIGGDPNATTIPNFLSTYTPNLVGASLGHHTLEYCSATVCPDFQYKPELDQFNAAQSAAMATNLPSHELKYLINEVRRNPNIDIAKDWKLLTLLIGANDVCSICQDKTNVSSPDSFENDVMKTLKAVYAAFPRTFVNLVLGLNVSAVYYVDNSTRYCQDRNRVFYWECPCIFDKNATVQRQMVDLQVTYFNQRLIKIANYYKSLNLTDFAVVTQPFMLNTVPKDLSPKFFSTLDCFHPSLVGHQAMATALWNSMLTPASKKKTEVNLNDTPMCPTADTLLYTF